MKIDVNNIYKSFRNEVVLKNISYSFSSGNIYSIVGRNGSGKSVLMKIIAGLYKQDKGEVLINGIDYNKDNLFCSSIGIVIEKATFIEDLTGFENLKLLASLNNKIDDKVISDTLDIVGLKEEKNKKFGKYSLGMCQKLSIAQAVMEDQDIILLDEPFNGIDRASVDLIKKYLVSLKGKNKIIIISTHIADDIIDISDIKLKIVDGVLLEDV